MLTFTEEILLLLLDDKDGSFVPIPKVNLGCAIAGAVLMDLAFAYRIDTDPESLVVNDRTPTGNPILDPTLAKIAAQEQPTTPGPGSGSSPLKMRPPSASKRCKASWRAALSCSARRG